MEVERRHANCYFLVLLLTYTRHIHCFGGRSLLLWLTWPCFQHTDTQWDLTLFSVQLPGKSTVKYFVQRKCMNTDNYSICPLSFPETLRNIYQLENIFRKFHYEQQIFDSQIIQCNRFSLIINNITYFFQGNNRLQFHENLICKFLYKMYFGLQAAKPPPCPLLLTEKGGSIQCTV